MTHRVWHILLRLVFFPPLVGSVPVKTLTCWHLLSREGVQAFYQRMQLGTRVTLRDGREIESIEEVGGLNSSSRPRVGGWSYGGVDVFEVSISGRLDELVF